MNVIPKISKGDTSSSAPGNSIASVHAAAEAAKAQSYASESYNYSSTAPNTGTNPPGANPNPDPNTTPPQTSPEGSPQGGDDVKCPWCSGNILVKRVGKILSHIAGFLQRSFSIKIPTGVLNYIKEHTPVSKTAARKGPCDVCKGKGTIKDPAAKGRAAAQQVANNLKNNSDQLAEQENKLAPFGGNKYTIVQGHETLEVGLSFNDIPAYSVIQNARTRHKGIISHSKLGQNGAPMFPEGATDCNYIQGTNPPAIPGGHYFIKCSNKFSLLAGAQGIDITTGGALTISGGITTITGPEITIGTQTGPLTLEGETVNINGKSIEVAPSDGDFFVRGKISNTGDLSVGGHAHLESVSFIHAECVGTKQTIDEASPNDLQTGPAFYGSLGVEGILQASLDLSAHVLAIASEPEKIKNAVGVASILNLVDKILNLTYMGTPFELLPTGFILPGTPMVLEIVGTGEVVPSTGDPGKITITAVAVPLAPVLLHNFPHTHSIPDLKHSHSVMLPDMDYTAQKSDQVRAKQGSLGPGSGPTHKTTSFLKVLEAEFQVITQLALAPLAAINKLVKKII